MHGRGFLQARKFANLNVQIPDCPRSLNLRLNEPQPDVSAENMAKSSFQGPHKRLEKNTNNLSHCQNSRQQLVQTSMLASIVHIMYAYKRKSSGRQNWLCEDVCCPLWSHIRKLATCRHYMSEHKYPTQIGSANLAGKCCTCKSWIQASKQGKWMHAETCSQEETAQT